MLWKHILPSYSKPVLLFKLILMKIYFSHGKKGTPNGNKILKMSELAKSKGFETMSIDYTDTFDPEIRAQRLTAILNKETDEYILVGSSMGGYISLVAEEIVTNKPSGIFLLAPALYLETYKKQKFTPHIKMIEVLHGWNDEVVPYQNSIKFCKNNGFILHLLDADHRFSESLNDVLTLFDDFLLKFK